MMLNVSILVSLMFSIRFSDSLSLPHDHSQTWIIALHKTDCTDAVQCPTTEVLQY